MWLIVGHIPIEIFLYEGSWNIPRHLNSTSYKVSPIPAEGLEVPVNVWLLLTFAIECKGIFILMKKFFKELYDHDFTEEIMKIMKVMKMKKL